MPPTEEDPVIATLVDVARWALDSVRAGDRRWRICRYMSGWFAERAHEEAEALELEKRDTPLLPPAPDDLEIQVTEGSSYPPSKPDD